MVIDKCTKTRTYIPAKLSVVSVLLISKKPDVYFELFRRGGSDFLNFIILVVISHCKHQVAFAKIITDKVFCFGLAAYTLKGVVMWTGPSSSGMVTWMKAGIYFNTRDLQLRDKQDLNERNGQNV